MKIYTNEPQITNDYDGGKAPRALTFTHVCTIAVGIRWRQKTEKQNLAGDFPAQSTFTHEDSSSWDPWSRCP